MCIRAERSKVLKSISIIDFIYSNRRKREKVIEEMDEDFIKEKKMRKEDENYSIRLKFLDIPIHSIKFLDRPVPFPSIPSILIIFNGIIEGN